MKKQIIPFLLFVSCFLSPFSKAQQNFSQYVDPMIGTGGHGHTFPGTTVPFGMVQLSPDTRVDGSWDGCSGYHYSDSIIYGFSHTHLSGTGCSDYGDIMIMPMMGEPSVDNKIYSSKFLHKNEKASPGFYSVKLDDDSINVELTSTVRVGFHKYIFKKNGQADIILDLTHRDKLLEGEIKVLDNKTIEVFRRSEAWAQDQYIYARIEFSKPFIKSVGTELSFNLIDSKEITKPMDAKRYFTFDVKKDESIFVKVAISTVSVEGAKKNMEAELPGWDFEKTKKEAVASWNKELSKIEATSSDYDKLKTFYTALYHTMIQPNVNMDVDGMYRGRDNKIHKAEGFTYYSVFSLWDTFRAAHPLYTIIEQKRTADFINTFLAQYEQGGRLPVWELASNETDCMIGYHSVSVIADAMVKGIKGFDYEKAFEAAKHSAMLDHLGLKAYKEKGFIAMEDENESVSKTVEYAYDDWCIAQMANVLYKERDYDYFMKRSQSWKNVFDPETNFMRPKKNGGWLTPFEPREVNNNYTEGNSWQYTFFVPQDVSGLINAMGGNDKFEKKLDELFTAPTQTTGRDQADITGLIGQYAHGNEPSHHMAYLYNFINKGSKTQSRIHQILSEFYKPTPDGLIGNEDCGQMSAWYVLSSIGLYQVTPGRKTFQIGTPFYETVKVHLENGKMFSVVSKNLSKENYFIQSLTLNGAAATNFETYQGILNGDTLVFEMGKIPNDVWSAKKESQIMSSFYSWNIVPVPSINTPSRVFDDSMKVEMNASAKVFYYVDDINTPQSKIIYKEYMSPFYIKASKVIYAFADDGKTKSDTVQGSFYKRPNHWTIKINSKYSSQYTAGGDQGIIDGLNGDVNWRKGEWQGYEGQDFEAIIDLQKEQSINVIAGNFLQDTRAWILMPTKVEYYTSPDNVNYTLETTVDNTISADDYTPQIKKFTGDLSRPTKARYVKVKASYFGKLPAWHQGAGGEAYIFIDEIEVR